MNKDSIYSASEYFNPYQSERNLDRRDYRPQQNINTYLVGNIIATVVGLLLFKFSCCIALLVGAVGILFSVLTKNCLDIGDYYKAKSYSTVALVLMIISFAFSFMILFVFILIGASFFALFIPFL